MGSFFYDLGRRAGPHVRKGAWLWHTLTGEEGDEIQAELAVGRDLAHEILQLFPNPHDEALHQRLQSISRPLVNRVKDKRREFQFFSLEAPEINAFALPGGFIFLHRPLLELCEDHPSELAFILAHEMAHVIRRHAVRRVIKSSALSLVLKAHPAARGLGEWVRTAGLRFLSSAHSQEDELEADVLGLRLVEAAGYDPRGPLDLLGRLEKLHPRSPSPLPEYFSTHPPLSLRRKKLQEHLRPPSSPRN